MRNYIKLFILFLFMSSDVYSNNEKKSYDFFSQNNSELNEDVDSGNANENYDPVPVPTPINDYLPILIIAAVGLGFFYRKEINQTIKSN